MKYRPFLLFAFIGSLLSANLHAEDLSLVNLDGTLRFTLVVAGGAASYQLDALDGIAVASVLENSPLGVVRSDADFTKDLTLLEVSASRTVSDDYTLIAGKQREVHRRSVERTFTLKNVTGAKLTLTVRAYSDGIAFRYGFPGNSSQVFYVTRESTGFNLRDDARVWVQPYSKVDTWAPGYESDYVNGVLAGTAALGAEGWALPLLSKSGKYWTLVTESGLESTYFGSHLEPQAPGGLYRLRPPEEPETYGVAPQAAAITLPWVSPWRVVVVGTRAGAIAESTLITDVARPAGVEDYSWVHPGMSSWSWWSDMNSPSDYAKLVPFVDAASHFGWSYCLLDLGWHRMKGGDAAQLIAYAARKKVGLVVWYNSAGRHNRVPDAGPRDVLDDPLLREAEFARIAALGIKGIKVDFMQSDKQWVIGLYHDIIRDAARHHLIVDFHGCTIPRGWDRTYPNLVTMEGVRGAEQYWDKTFAENAQTFNSIYVFTRNAVGPMDYTPTILTNAGASNPGLVPHLTTNAHELALLVVFQSGIQHVVDPASSLIRQPGFVQDYLTKLPAAWDESRFLAGAPGELAVVARRNGKTWYVSGINGLKTPQTITVPLDFLGAGMAQMSLITDGATQTEFTHAARSVSGKDVLQINLAARGGFAARLVP